jgi:hypothetical protein
MWVTLDNIYIRRMTNSAGHTSFRERPDPRSKPGESHLEFGGDIGWVLRFG